MSDSAAGVENKPRMTARQIVSEFVGWGGALLILGAYGLNRLGLMETKELAYTAMNLVGSVGVLINSFDKKAWPSVGLNAAWFALGMIGIFTG